MIWWCVAEVAQAEVFGVEDVDVGDDGASVRHILHAQAENSRWSVIGRVHDSHGSERIASESS